MEDVAIAAVRLERDRRGSGVVDGVVEGFFERREVLEARRDFITLAALKGETVEDMLGEGGGGSVAAGGRFC